MNKLYERIKQSWLSIGLLIMLLLATLKPIVFAQTVPAKDLENVCGSFTIEHRDYIDEHGNNVTISMTVGDTGEVNHDGWLYRIARVNGGVIQEKIWEHYVEPAQAMHSFLAKPGEKFLLTFFVPTESGYSSINCGALSFETPLGESDFSALDSLLGITTTPPPAPANDAAAQSEKAFMPLMIEDGGYRDDKVD